MRNYRPTAYTSKQRYLKERQQKVEQQPPQKKQSLGNPTGRSPITGWFIIFGFLDRVNMCVFGSVRVNLCRKLQASSDVCSGLVRSCIICRHPIESPNYG